MKRKVNSYTDDFKLKVVLEYLMSDSTFALLQKKYGIRSGSCITEWIRKFDLAPPSKCIVLKQVCKKNKQISGSGRKL